MKVVKPSYNPFRADWEDFPLACSEPITRRNYKKDSNYKKDRRNGEKGVNWRERNYEKTLVPLLAVVKRYRT